MWRYCVRAIDTKYCTLNLTAMFFLRIEETEIYILHIIYRHGTIWGQINFVIPAAHCTSIYTSGYHSLCMTLGKTCKKKRT